MKNPKSVNSRRKHKGIWNHADYLSLDDLPAPSLDALFNGVEHVIGRSRLRVFKVHGDLEPAKTFLTSSVAASVGPLAIDLLVIAFTVGPLILSLNVLTLVGIFIVAFVVRSWI